MSSIDFSSHKLLEIFVQGLIKYDILIQKYIHKIHRPELNDEKDKALILLAHFIGAEPNKQYMEDKCIQLCNFLITIIGQQVSKCQAHNHAPEYALVLGPRWWSKAESKIRLLPVVMQSQVAPAKAKNAKTLNFNALIKNSIRVIESGGTLTDPEVVGDLAQRLQIGAPEILEQWKRMCDGVRRNLVAQLVTELRVYTTTAMDWAVGDFLLLYDHSFKLFKAEYLSYVDYIPILEELYKEVLEKNIEDALRSKKRWDIMEAWINAYTSYKYNCRNISLVCIQRQWHELKFEARSRVLAYWHGKAGTPAPHPLLASIVSRFEYIVLEPFPSWSDLVRSNLVIQVTKPDVEDDSTDPLPVKAATSMPWNTGDCEVAAKSISHATKNKDNDKPNNATISSVDVLNTIDPSKAKIKLIFENGDSDSEVTMSAVMFEEASDDAFDAVSNDFARSQRQTDNNVIRSNDKKDKEMTREIKKENTNDTVDNDNLDVFETSSKPRTVFTTDDVERKKVLSTNSAILDDKIDAVMRKALEKDNNVEATDNGEDNSPIDRRVDKNEINTKFIDKNRINVMSGGNVTKQQDPKFLMITTVPLVRCDLTPAWKLHSRNGTIDVREFDRHFLRSHTEPKSGKIQGRASHEAVHSRGRSTEAKRRASARSKVTKRGHRRVGEDLRGASLSKSFLANDRNVQQLLRCRPVTVDLVRLPANYEPDNRYCVRTTKKVELPDIERVRMINSTMLTAEVAPVAARIEADKRTSGSPDGKGSSLPVDIRDIKGFTNVLPTIKTQECAKKPHQEAAPALEKLDEQKLAPGHENGATASNRYTSKTANDCRQVLDLYHVVESELHLPSRKQGGRNHKANKNSPQSKQNYRIIKVVRASDGPKAEPKRRQKRGTGVQSKRKGRTKNADTRNDVALKCYDAKKFKRLGLWKKLRNGEKGVENVNVDTLPKAPDDAHDEWQHQKNVALKYFRLPNMIPAYKNPPLQPKGLPGSHPTQAPESKIRNTPQVLTILNKKGVIVSGGYSANLKPRHRQELGKDTDVVIDLIDSKKRRVDLRSAPTSAVVDLTVDQAVRDSTPGSNVPDDALTAVVDPNRQGSGNPQLSLNDYYARPAASGPPGMPGVVPGDTNTPVNIMPATNTDRWYLPNLAPRMPPMISLHPQTAPSAPPRMVLTATGLPAHVASDPPKSFVHLGGIKNTAGGYFLILSNSPNLPNGDQPAAQVPENTLIPVYTISASGVVSPVSPSMPELTPLSVDGSPSVMTNKSLPLLRTYSKPKPPMKVLRMDSSRPYLALSATLDVLVTTRDLKCERPTYWSLAPLKERIRILFAAEKGGAEVFNPPTLHVNGDGTEHGPEFAAWLKSVTQNPPAAPITEAERAHCITEGERVPCAPITETEKVPCALTTEAERAPCALTSEAERACAPTTESEGAPCAPITEAEKAPCALNTKAQRACAPATESERAPCASITEFERTPCASATEVDRACAPITESERAPCTSTPELEKALCAPTTKAERAPCVPITEAEKAPCTSTPAVEKAPCAPTTEAEKAPCAPTGKDVKPLARIKVKSFARLVDDEIAKPAAPERVYVQHRLYQKMSDRPLTYAEVITVLPDNVIVKDLMSSKVPVYILTQSGNLVLMQDTSLPSSGAAQIAGSPEASKRPWSASDADESPAKLPATEPPVAPD